MPSLRDRLAAALAPQYTVDDRVGRGGMGAVYRAYDNDLRRWVAVKVLLPELATEAAARRFLREARTLASLSHPHIVPVHHVGESNGLFYLVMEFIEGPTLAEVLADGPLEADRVVKLGRDLLDALQAVHQQGRVHCDVKPANIFVTDKRVLLADFGIATASTHGDDTVTVRDFQPHTPRYATPEQVEHRDVSPQTDLYAVGIVLYEALTARGWFEQGVRYEPKRADWHGVPRAVRRVLLRSLHPFPERRWPDAVTFRRALWKTRRPWVVPAAMALAAVSVTTGAVLGVFGSRLVGSQFGSEKVVEVRADFTRGANNDRALTDSVTNFVLERLSLNTDFRACGPSENCDTPATILLVSAERGDGIALEMRSADAATTIFSRGRADAVDGWHDAANSMMSDFLLQIHQRDTDILNDLPTQALPRDAVSMRSFIEAERLWHEANWSEARRAYARASEIDSTCYVCSWRIADVARWDQQDPDPAHRQRVLAQIDRFPQRYRLLIDARFASPVDRRLEILERVAETDDAFFSAHFELGDELLHRGGLAGETLERAATELRAAAERRPSFTPAWEHVVWANLLLRDTTQAGHAMRTLDALPQPRDVQTQNYRLLLRIALSFQTGRDQTSMADLSGQLPELMKDDRFPVVARFMMGHGTPTGAIQLGLLLEQAANESELPYAGLFGQYVGFFARGMLDQAHRVAARVERLYPDKSGFHVFAVELDAALALADSSRGHAVPGILDALETLFDSPTHLRQRESVAFVHTLLRRRYNIPRLAIGDIVQRAPLVQLLRADSLARSSQRSRAITLTDSLVRREWAVSAGLVVDSLDVPVFRSIVYMLRAEWLAAEGQVRAAAAAMRWHDNTDIPDLPLKGPMTYEADWALGTFAAWKRTHLLSSTGSQREKCRLLRNVAAVWADGDSTFSARAVISREQWRQRSCSDLVPVRAR